jgi:hypothetical protein
VCSEVMELPVTMLIVLLRGEPMELDADGLVIPPVEVLERASDEIVVLVEVVIDLGGGKDAVLANREVEVDLLLDDDESDDLHSPYADWQPYPQ